MALLSNVSFDSSITNVDPTMYSTIVNSPSDAQAYDNRKAQTQEAQNLNTPSPYYGQVYFARDRIPDQYVTIGSSSAEPTSLTGWSIESINSHTRTALPQATGVLVTGRVNDVNPVILAPGDSLIVAVGASPVGASFRENICSSYLQQYQHFSPPISTQCPDEVNALWGSDTYGGECASFIQSHKMCQFQDALPLYRQMLSNFPLIWGKIS